MAEALPDLNKPRRIALATTVTEITWPIGTDYLRIEVPSGETVYLTVGVADGAAVGSHYETYVGSTVEIRAVNGLGSIGLAVAAGAPTIAVTPMTRGL